MNRLVTYINHLAISTILLSFGFFTSRSLYNQPQVPSELIVSRAEMVLNPVQEDSVFTVPTTVVYLDNAFIGFKESLAFKESQGKYTAVNTFGYLGKYQFGEATLHLMGINDLDGFLHNPVLQEQAFKLNVARNKWILRRYIKRFEGKRINGTTITESGMIAAAHLAGAGNVKKYLASYGANNVADDYGSNVSYYLKKFSGYDLSFIKAKQNPRI